MTNSTLSPVLTVTLNPAIDLNLEVSAWPQGDFARATSSCRAAGGKGINVAHVLHELGVSATAMCVTGGIDGRIFLDLLRQAPFGAAPVEIAGATRTNVSIHCKRHGERIKVNQPGPAVTAREWKKIEGAFKDLVQGRAWAVLSGALPPGAPVEVYARLTRLAHKAGARVALDCAGASMLAALSEKPDLIKPNRGELAETIGGRFRTRGDTLAGARELLTRGARLAVISNGPGECLAVGTTETWLARPPQIEVGSIMGGGDSIVAGMVAGALQGLSMSESLRLAVACGAASAAADETKYAKRREIEKYMKQVSLRRLKVSK